MTNNESGGSNRIERDPAEIAARIEALRKERDQFRKQDDEIAADQRETAIVALKWVLGEDIALGERYQ